MSRVTNMFYIKAVEAADRKFSFGKQAYIGNDLINVYFPRKDLLFTPGVMMPPLGFTQSDKLTNTFVGGSIYRSEGSSGIGRLLEDIIFRVLGLAILIFRVRSINQSEHQRIPRFLRSTPV